MLWLALRALFGVVMLALAGFGCGAWIANGLPATCNRIERLGISLLGGLGIFSLALFLIGQISFSRTIILAALGAAVLLSVRPLWRVWRNLRLAPRMIPRDAFIPCLIVLIVLVLTAAAGTAEITGDWNVDAVAYHLLGPSVWLREGVIRPVLDNSHAAFPQIPETLFAVLLSVGGNRAPDFSSWLTLELLLLISAGLAMRMGLSAPQGWWVAAIVATMPAVYAGSYNCFVDGLFAAFVLAAARIGFDAQYIKEWAIFGVFCGLAMGTKYTGLLAVPALAICCAFVLLNRDQWNRTIGIRNLGVALALAAAVASPFYLRNWIVLGCPIYPPPPGYASFCSPKYFPRQAIEQFHNYIYLRGAGLGRGWLAFLKLPFNLTYHTANFHGAGGIGLCPLALAPFGIIAMCRNPFARSLALFAVLLTCMWFFTQQESRFLIHAYVVAAIFSVAGWNYVSARCGRLQRFTAAAVVGISILYGLLMIVRGQTENLRAVVSPNFAQLRRARGIPYLASFDYLNSDPSVKRILILDRSVPPYYSRKSYVKPVGQWGELTLPQISTGLETLPHVRELHITHVLDVVSPVSGFQIERPPSNFELIFQSTDQRIYRVD
jgi:Dolichyl-phosphate-mannose-protein mannosyltransferase